jgi:tetratricopeptide (TPR) repeat protein
VNQGKSAEAIEQYRRAKELDPKSAQAHHGWGVALANQQKYGEAIEKYRQAAELDPASAEIHKNWGATLAAQGKSDEAVEQYRRATEIDPRHAQALHGWGVALANQQKYGEAIEKYRQAEELAPTDANIHINWGAALENQGKPTEAIEQHRRATELDPKSAQAYHNWGLVLDKQGHFREAIEKTRHAMRVNPDFAYAYHNVAYYLWKQGDYKAGRRAWKDALQVYGRRRISARDEKNADFFFYYGGVLYDIEGDFNAAEDVFLEGLSVNPDHPGLLMSLGDLYTERCQQNFHSHHIKEKLTRHWEQTFHAHPIEDKLAELWKAREHFERSELILRQRLEQSESLESRKQLGKLYLKIEKYHEACEHLEMTHRRYPEDPEICGSLGVAYSRIEDYFRAADYFEKAHKVSPADLTIWSNLAETYLKIKKVDLSEKEYRRILQITEEHIDSQVGLGEVYTAMADAGETDLYYVARKHYGRAIQLAESRQGSKRVTPKELAAMFYARGYAAVKAYEALGPLGDESLLSASHEDFEQCCRHDPEHYKGERARDKITKRRGVFTPDWVTRKLAPWLILAPSFFILIAAQIGFWFYKTDKFDIGQYAKLTFGALVFLIVGLVLPQISKLKGPGIELEKSPVNQITASGSLGINK